MLRYPVGMNGAPKPGTTILEFRPVTRRQALREALQVKETPVVREWAESPALSLKKTMLDDSAFVPNSTIGRRMRYTLACVRRGSSSGPVYGA
ncbi:hypothetical protein RE943_07520 [Prescottella equi]|nr:hypothetical protein RE943_07520 [Prescottella equi]